MSKILLRRLVLLAILVLFSACSESSTEKPLPASLIPTSSLPSDDTLDLTGLPDSQAFHTVYSLDNSYPGIGTLVNVLTLKMEDDGFIEKQNAMLALTDSTTSYWQDFLQNEQEKYFSNKEQFFCDVTLLGYDDQYAYTKMWCQGYTVNPTGVIEEGTGQGDWIRFEYAGADFGIVDFLMIGNDTDPNKLIPDELLKDYDNQ